jgi:hypothetical protein
VSTAAAKLFSELSNHSWTGNSRLPIEVLNMSKVEILAQLPKLTREERYEIRVKLAEIDSDAWLDDDDPLTTRRSSSTFDWPNTRQTRESAIPFETFKEQLKEKSSR